MRRIIEQLAAKGLKISTAESCTGGLLSKLITDIDGASAVFECGICSYSNEIKHKLLGVSRQTLQSYGAVSAQVAQQMASGVAKLAAAQIGVGITGIAGPGGGSAQKPVGLVYISVWTHGEQHTTQNNFEGDRQTVRMLAVHKAIEMIRDIVEKA